MENFSIRLESEPDFRTVETLVRDAFWNVYRPGCSEHFVLHQLRNDSDFVPSLSFVMEQEGEIIGQCAFVRAAIACDDGTVLPVLTMGPICVAPDKKGQGYGKALLDFCLVQAGAQGFGAVLIEGNIDFYGKSGFTFARNFGVRYHGLPDGVDDSFFLCKELSAGFLNGVSGEYQTPQGYFVDDADVDAFDAAFPPKQKLKLPGQLF